MYQRDITGEINQDTVSHFSNIFTDEEYKYINLKFFKKLISHFEENVDLSELVDVNLSNKKNLDNVSLLEL
jgi:hypothetical protein